MKRCSLPVLLLVASVAIAVTPIAAWDLLWVHQFNSSAVIAAYGGAADASGVYASGAVLGDLTGTTPIGGYDAYVRKVDHAGAVMWTRRVGTTRFDSSEGVAADADGSYIAGLTCGTLPGNVAVGGCDAYAAKVRSDGALLWATQFGTAAFDWPDQYGAIAVHPSGVYVAGKTEGTFPGGTPPGAGLSNTFLARLDRNTGALLWVRQFGRPDPAFFNAGGVGVDDTGVAVADNSETGFDSWAAEVRKYNFDGSLQWSRVFDEHTTPCGHPIFSLTSHRGHVYVIGQTYEWALTSCEDQPYGQSYIVGLLQNFDASGNTIWQRRIKAGIPGAGGGSGLRFTGAKAVHVNDRGVFVGGNVRHVDFAGYVSRAPSSDRSVCSDPAFEENAIWKGFDAYVRGYDFDGNVVWTHQFGSSLYELVSGLGSDGTRVYAAGLTRCVVENGADPESGALVDAFLAGVAIDPTTPSGGVQLIVGRIETLSDAGRISSGEFTALVGHLESALAALDRSNANVAKASLQAFVSLVDSFRASGRLTSAEAGALIAAALAIAEQL